MKHETLRRLIDEYKGDNLAEYLATEIKNEEATINRKRRWHEQCSSLAERHKKENDELEAIMKDIQKNCHHHEYTYYGDASGGNDSHTYCDTCGKELRR